MCTVTPTATPASSNCSHHRPMPAVKMLTHIAAHNMEMETIFTRRGIARSSMKSRMYRPSTRWWSSQPCSRSELRANNAAANNRKGVVGSTGSAIPNTPNATHTTPMTVNANLTPIPRPWPS